MAVIGMGGFAGAHQGAIQTLEKAGACRLVCTCDPKPEAFSEQQAAWDFAGRGVAVYTDYIEMLDRHSAELDMVTVPTPVPLHAPMHRACVERELACYLEKPPTLAVEELEQMIAVEAQAVRQTQIGFNFIIETPRRTLKQRLLAGEFGALRRVSFLGHWPRPTSYYARAPWAGRLRMDGRLVLDSCIGNAMAHYLHNVLFWAGQRELLDWAELDTLRAEMARAHAIEGMDTVFAEARCANGVELRVAATHAAQGDHFQREQLECDQATLTYVTQDTYRIAWRNGQEEQGEAERRDLFLENMQAYMEYVEGKAPRPLTRLVDSRPFVHFNSLAYVSAGTIPTVSEADIRRGLDQRGEYVAVAGICNLCETFVETGRFPSEQGAAWARPGRTVTLADLSQLESTIEQMCQLTL